VGGEPSRAGAEAAGGFAGGVGVSSQLLALLTQGRLACGVVLGVVGRAVDFDVGAPEAEAYVAIGCDVGEV